MTNSVIEYIGEPKELVKVIKSGNIYYKQAMMCLKNNDIPAALSNVKKCLRLKKATALNIDNIIDYVHPVYYDAPICECFEMLKAISIRYNFDVMEGIEKHEKQYKESKTYTFNNENP